MSSPYPYGQYPPPPPPNPYFQGNYSYGPQGYYQPTPPPHMAYAPPPYYHQQNDNTCCWACLAGLCLCCAIDELC